MIVKNIEWLSKEALEAEVIVAAGETTIICFSCPCKWQEGDIIDTLDTLDGENIVRSFDHFYRIETLKKLFEYRMTGLLLDRVQSRVRVDGFYINLDAHIPGDIKEGEFISFRIGRLDLN